MIVIDVRPAEEYRQAHIKGAPSIPLPELKDRLHEIPQDGKVVVYCREPYCVLAPEAVAILATAGYHARRLDDGLPEWRKAGWPIDVQTKLA